MGKDECKRKRKTDVQVWFLKTQSSSLGILANIAKILKIAPKSSMHLLYAFCYLRQIKFHMCEFLSFVLFVTVRVPVGNKVP